MRHEQKLWHRGIALLHALFCMPFHSLHFNLQRNAKWCPFLLTELIPELARVSPGAGVLVWVLCFLSHNTSQDLRTRVSSISNS